MKRAGVMAAFAVLCGVLGIMLATLLAIVDASNGPQPVPATILPSHSVGGGGGAAAPADPGAPAPQRTTRNATNADLTAVELRLLFAGMGLYGLVLLGAIVIQTQNRANLSVVTSLAAGHRWRRQP